MENYNIYKDIADRTQGAIYIGVVGPVRTGKSTFIKRFTEKLVLPVAEEEKRAQIQDEMPQSSGGKTIMTTEPKFVPAQPAEIKVGETTAKVRLIDCVGFPVAGAMGMEEDGKERMVNTPWQEEPLPFTLAAKIGTEKVIHDHSTVAVLVTTDGSVTDIPRESYIEAEERTVQELTALKKPFVVLLNCKDPSGETAVSLAKSLEERYHVRVLPVNVEELSEEGLLRIVGEILLDFPVCGINVNLPDWMQTLPSSNPYIASIISDLRTVAPKIEKMRDCKMLEECFLQNENLSGVESLGLNLAEGVAECTLLPQEGLYFKVLSEVGGQEIKSDCDLFAYVKTLAESKKGYDRIRDAFDAAKEVGYGVVQPDESELELFEPKMTKHGQTVGIHLMANAPTYHILKVNVNSSVTPVVGSGKSGEEFVQNILSDYATDEEKVWNTEVFGKTLKSLIDDGLEKKSGGMPELLQKKMRRTLAKIVNDGRGNILCILL